MTSDDSGHDGVDRRKFLAAAAGVTGVTMAGCVEGEGGDNNETGGDTETLAPPDKSFDERQLDQPLRYIVQSIEYQNMVLQELHND